MSLILPPPPPYEADEVEPMLWPMVVEEVVALERHDTIPCDPPEALIR